MHICVRLFRPGCASLQSTMRCIASLRSALPERRIHSAFVHVLEGIQYKIIRFPCATDAHIPSGLFGTAVCDDPLRDPRIAGISGEKGLAKCIDNPRCPRQAPCFVKESRRNAELTRNPWSVDRRCRRAIRLC